MLTGFLIVVGLVLYSVTVVIASAVMERWDLDIVESPAPIFWPLLLVVTLLVLPAIGTHRLIKLPERRRDAARERAFQMNHRDYDLGLITWAEHNRINGEIHRQFGGKS